MKDKIPELETTGLLLHRQMTMKQQPQAPIRFGLHAIGERAGRGGFALSMC